MNEARNLVNELADRLEDTRKANSSLYLIAAAIAHGEGTATDYSDALTLLYENLAATISDVTGLIAGINELMNKGE
ncbi:MAG: hypothetical protein J6M64_01225 [Oscillospiraceae bacterium]|nr:hypothetical protein [Oscillospiraceae bacterium]